MLSPHRDGGQAQFVPRPVMPDEGRLAQLMQALRARPREQHDLASMAKLAAMSARTLQRRFLESTGTTALQWLIRERVAYARELLEAGRLSRSEVAEAAGFNSDESFRRHLTRGSQPVSRAGRR